MDQLKEVIEAALKCLKSALESGDHEAAECYTRILRELHLICR